MVTHDIGRQRAYRRQLKTSHSLSFDKEEE